MDSNLSVLGSIEILAFESFERNRRAKRKGEASDVCILVLMDNMPECGRLIKSLADFLLKF